jgi:hypothetical protein
VDERESKDYSWEFVRADKVLEKGPCELVYACMVPSGTSATCDIYTGTDTTGKFLIGFVAAVMLTWEFRPMVPIYCNNGIYVDIGSDVTGVLVQWRKL